MHRSSLQPTRLSALLPAIVGFVACGGNTVADGFVAAPPTGSGEGGDASESSIDSGAADVDETSSEVSSTALCSTMQPRYDALSGVQPSVAVDYVELREWFVPFAEADAAPPQPQESVVSSSGTLCGSAADKAKCEADFFALKNLNGWKHEWVLPNRTRYLVTTAQDTIRTILTLDDLRAFVVPVDNAFDAALLVAASGQYRPTCQTVTKPTASTWEVLAVSGDDCWFKPPIDNRISVSTDGTLTVTFSKEQAWGGCPCGCPGRRPEGLAPYEADGANAVGRFFSEAAYLEAASVVAFERLSSELLALGAPLELVTRAASSRDDEARHTKMMTAIAERFGASCKTPSVAAAEGRSVVAIAIENAVEGCVNETWAALVAHWQAQEAIDPTIAAAMHRIAEDETRHAQLAWEVAAWLEPQLSDRERDAVEKSRERALHELRRSITREPDEELVTVAGLPRAAQAEALLGALEGEMCSAA